MGLGDWASPNFVAAFALSNQNAAGFAERLP
jgi:hypothetical protein